MWEERSEPITGTKTFRVVLTERDSAKMSHEQWEMLKDGVVLIKAALRGDTAPKWLGSVGAMSHEET